ncbi:hypothetical protein J2Y45_003089 [Dyadobacter sp. BE34]|uniref:Uncharacterized protein n=1 Tax=Dyadobacter fermentans TaxID=94254 RepID=A0ABU1QTX9_9BACT|nr:hypothetical protein [Dyadobacter fermentans]MDR7043638.1 hypothetical protein [Dyadobacter sp. BE242]MDR7197950.1 hypothetical protein [Dyadobacter sp. BE34]MDR7214617.1 hypothetical protein [Dyadobacter sp. BE31]MDR7262152.1 hypothetical protein [Dyadobacter sp. BE32]
MFALREIRKFNRNRISEERSPNIVQLRFFERLRIANIRRKAWLPNRLLNVSNWIESE